MKKIYIVALWIMLCSSAFAQTQIPNGNLESWYEVINPVNPGVNYWEPGTGPTDNWLATLNSLAQIPSSLLGPGPVTVSRTDDKHSGSYAARLVTDTMNLGYSTIVIPGMLGTATMVGMGAKLGRSSTAKPMGFKGWYKYEPANGDSCIALVLVSKWNAALHKRDTIGYGRFVTNQQTSAYTEFNIPVSYSYPNGQETPDSLTVLAISSAGFNVFNFLACQGQVNSTLLVDDLDLVYASGITEHLMSEIFVMVYPNPASENINFEADKELKGAAIRIYSPSGAVVKNLPFSGKKISLSTGDLTSGLYQYRLISGNEILSQGSFIKK